MSLSLEQLNTLKRPFARADHEFIRNFVYLTEEAITTRIEEVDPSWEFSVLNMSQVGSQAVVLARLTICGVFRDGVGMQQVLEKAGEAEKGAATDALKRCARLFGVGRYLLDAPKEDQFNAWLAQKQKEYGQEALKQPQQAQRPPQPPPAQSSPVSGGNSRPLASDGSTPSSPSSAVASSSAKTEFFPDDAVVMPLNTEGDDDHLPRDVNGLPVLGSLDMKALGKLAQDEGLVKGRNHFSNLIDLLYREGSIRAASKQDAVMDAIRKHYAEKDLAKEGVGAR